MTTPNDNPWPILCPECKGEPMIKIPKAKFIEWSKNPPFKRYDCWLSYRDKFVRIRCAICEGLGTVIAK
jgi:hypothetical protein